MPDDFGFTRRQWLGGGAVVATMTFAGCGDAFFGGNGGSSTRTPPSYEHLERTRVYVASDVSLRLPTGVSRVDAPATADLVVLPGSTDVTATKSRDWLVAGKGVALVGTDAQSTFIHWHRSEVYENTFGGAYAKGDPPPEMIVAFAQDRKFVRKHGVSWGHDGSPTNAELLRGLENVLADHRTRTPTE